MIWKGFMIDRIVLALKAKMAVRSSRDDIEKGIDLNAHGKRN